MDQKDITGALDIPGLSQSLSQVDKVIFESLGNNLDSFLKDRLSGGKRLRPILLILAAGRLADSKIMNAAAAVELVHQASKLHDDVLDEDAAQPAKYLLGGDKLLSAGLTLAAGQGTRTVQPLSAAIAKMIEGEYEQARLGDSREPDDERYQQACLLKTASLFAAAASIGARLGLNDEFADKLENFGRQFGLAYQINDDITDGYFTQHQLSAAKTEGRLQLQAALDSLEDLASSADPLKRFAAAALPGLS